MVELIKQSDEVYIAQNDIVSFGTEEVLFLKIAAAQNKRNRARICAHKSNHDPMHEMLIAIGSRSYIQPHKHFQKTESFHIIEGLVDVVTLNEEGRILEVIGLGDFNSGLPYFCRISAAEFHTLKIRSEILIMHEVTTGPFDKKLTIPGDFAPADTDFEEVDEYVGKLTLQISEFKKNSR
jgi:cupin fold WbuC family metalloprotein